MAAPKTTVWELEPHTRAKHEILKRYLQAWTPILSQGGFSELLYIDGFAGPGRYSKGEDGSPIIALKTALEQRVQINAQIQFLFVEEKPDRATVLQQCVDELHLPANFQVEFGAGELFETAFEFLFNRYKLRLPHLPPTFAFIDPFGWTGAPYSIVKNIMSNPSCEVLVTFMYEEINRFIGLPDQENNFDKFFGTPNWRKGIEIEVPRDRNRYLHDLYMQQLHDAASATFVRSFEMRNASNVTDYFLFYATKSLRGLQKMKEAMWKVDEAGEFSFADATNEDQLILFSKEPRYDVLQRQILDQFDGQEVTVGQIERFVLAQTAFRETHYKRQILKPLELADPARIEVINPPIRRNRGTYGDKSLRIRFL